MMRWLCLVTFRRGNPIAGGLHWFVGHSFLPLLTGLTRAISVTSIKTSSLTQMGFENVNLGFPPTLGD